MSGSASAQHDLFFSATVRSYVNNPRFLRRDWLAHELDACLSSPDCRFVLLTAAPGAGKSTFIAQLAHDHADWPVYFIRRDQRTPLGDVSARSFLLHIGYQLAALHPQVFEPERVKMVVEQRVRAVEAGGAVVAANVERLLASPFYQQVVWIRQQIEVNGGDVTGLRVGEWVAAPRLLPLNDLQYMALIDPVQALFDNHPDRRIVILVDAFYDLHYPATTETLLSWLTNLPQLPPNIRWVLTARPHDSALRTFCDKQAPYLCPLMIEPRDHRVQDDLHVYVQHVTALPEVASILATTEPGSTGFAAQAVAKADGNLGYLDALARGIAQAISVNNAQALHELLALRQLPDQMQGLYAFFLHQIRTAVSRQGVEVEEPSSGEVHVLPSWPSVYKRVLGVLSVAREPLSIEQIRRLSAIMASQDYVVEALDWLRQFLEPVDHRFRLYHSTVAEFLGASSTRDWMETQDLYADPLRWHCRIADYYLSAWGGLNQGLPALEDASVRNLDGGYGLRHLPVHLDKSGQIERLRQLLLDFDWLQAKLAATDVAALLSDYELLPGDATARRVRAAICLAAAALVADPTHLAGQLLGRLQAADSPNISALLDRASRWQGARWLRPLSASLTAPGGPLQRLMTPHAAGLRTLVSAGPRLVAVGNDGAIVEWHTERGTGPRQIAAIDEAFWAVAITPDGRRAVSAGPDGEIWVWHLAARRSRRRLEGYDGDVLALAITPNGQRVAAGSTSGSLFVWETNAPKAPRTITGQADWITALALTHDGRRAIFGSDGGELWVWDLEAASTPRRLSRRTRSPHRPTGRARDIVPPPEFVIRSVVFPGTRGMSPPVRSLHQRRVRSVAVTDDGRRAVSVSGDGSLWIWDVEARRRRRLATRPGSVLALTITPDGHRAISGAADGTVRLWELSMSDESATGRPDHGARVSALALAPNGRRAVSGAVDGSLLVWDLEGTVRRRPLAGHKDGISALAIATDGRRALVGSDRGVLWLCELEAATPPRQLSGHTGAISALGITADGQRVASGSFDCTVQVQPLDDGADAKRFDEFSAWSYEAQIFAVAPDGRRAIVGSPVGRRPLFMWTLGDESSARNLSGASIPVSHAALAADGRRVAFCFDHSLGVDLTVDEHGGVRDGPMTEQSLPNFFVLDVNDERWRHFSAGRGEQFISMTLTPDGRRAVLGTSRGSLKLLDLDSETVIADFVADAPLTCLAVAPDGSTLVAGDGNGRVHFLSLAGN